MTIIVYCHFRFLSFLYQSGASIHLKQNLDDFFLATLEKTSSVHVVYQSDKKALWFNIDLVSN